MARKKKQEECYRYKDCPEGLNGEVYYKIRQRRLQMLIHSHLYYRMDNNIVGDKQFDRWAYELRDIQKDYPAESQACDLYEEFADWDGTTGYHLSYFSWVDGIAKQILAEHNKYVGGR